MHNNQYNLYIDLDEEITIVVGRVRAAKASEITLVVPQHAALLQSIINLRLLQREAKKQNKHIIIATQDEEGADFAERAGIPVVPLQEWQDRHTYDEPASDADLSPATEYVTPHRGAQHIAHGQPEMAPPAMDGMRHESVHGAQPMSAAPMTEADPTGLVEEVEHIMEQDELPSAAPSLGMDIAPQQPRAMDMGVSLPKSTPRQSLEASLQQSLDNPSHESVHTEFTSTDVNGDLQSHAHVPAMNFSELEEDREERGAQRITNDYGPEYDYHDQSPLQRPDGDNRLTGAEYALSDNEKSFTGPQVQSENRRYNTQGVQEQHHKDISFLRKLILHTKRAFTRRHQHDSVLGLEKKKSIGLFHGSSMVIGVLIVVIIGATLILPFSRIELETIELRGQQDVVITAEDGERDVDIERRVIGGRIIEKDIAVTATVPATGASSTEAQKAQGTIKIINKHSTSPQPLVATTRFLAEDGTLFRLVQATTVPGFTQRENGDVIPGEIEALVAADEPGEAANIEPTTFTIPGFGEGSDKIREITGASTLPMTGGSEKSSDKKTVSQADLDKAKSEAEAKREAFIRNEIEGLLRPDAEVYLSDTLEEEIIRSEPNTTLGSAVDEVDHTIVTHVRAFVFSHLDAEKIARSVLAAQQPRLDQASTSYTLEYGSAKANYDEKKVSVNYTAIADVPQTVNTEAFVEDVAGKKHDDLKEIMTEKYPTISNIFITSYPSFPAFLSQKISPLAGMTSVEVK